MAIENDTSDKLITLDNLAVFKEEIDAGKQDTLVSGTNIKTINNSSILGSGNLSVGGGIEEISDQYIRITDLAAGVYKLTYDGTKYLYYCGTSSTSTHTVAGGAGTVVLVVSKYSTTYWHWWYINGSTDYAALYYGYTYSSGGSATNITFPTKTSDLTNDSGFITINDVPQEIYWCAYGTTTYSDISTAISNGKLPYCLYDDHGYIYSMTFGNVHYFTSVYFPYIYILRCHENAPYWSKIVSTAETASNKVTSISNSSTNSQYPSAKCVYDNIENVREVAEGKKQTYVVDYSYNPIFNSQQDKIEVSSITTIDNEAVSEENLQIGDNVYVLELDVPDRWVCGKKTSSVIQLCNKTTPTGTNKWFSSTGASDGLWARTADSTNNLITFTKKATTTSGNFQLGNFSVDVTTESTHVYLTRWYVENNLGTTGWLSGLSGSNSNSFEDGYKGYAYLIATNETLSGGYFYFFCNNSEIAQDATIIVGKPQVFDLTAIYGPSAEPSTYEAFIADYPNDFYPYNTDSGSVVAVLSILETVKPNIESISINGTNVQPVLGNADIIVPTKTSDLTNDSDFATHTDLDNYVDLISDQQISGNKTLLNKAAIKFGDAAGNGMSIVADSSSRLKITNNNNAVVLYLQTNGMFSPNNMTLGSANNKFNDLYLGGSLINGNYSITVPNIASKTELASYVDLANEQTITGLKYFNNCPKVASSQIGTGKNLFATRWGYGQWTSTGGSGSSYIYFKLPDDTKTYTLSIYTKDAALNFGSGNVFGITGSGGSPSTGYQWLINGNQLSTSVRVITPSDMRYISLYTTSEATFEALIAKYNIQLEEGDVATAYEP